MSPTEISAVCFGIVFGGCLFGFWLRTRLPDHHLHDDSKMVLQLGTGLIATMAALVLGLLTASAKDKFDAMSEQVRQTSANIVLFDRALAHYGSETNDVRALVRETVAARIATWQDKPLEGGAPPVMEKVQETLRALSPTTDAQRALRDRALELSTTIMSMRWLALEESGSSVSWPFLIVMVFWLTVIFMSFGLLSRPNATILVVLFVCALSVSTSIFLILELDHPFQGLIHVSKEPLEIALEHLGK